MLDPGKTPKIDKCAVLNDAIRAVTELRSEAEKLKDSKESLQEKIKELKVCNFPGSFTVCVHLVGFVWVVVNHLSNRLS